MSTRLFLSLAILVVAQCQAVRAADAPFNPNSSLAVGDWVELRSRILVDEDWEVEKWTVTAVTPSDFSYTSETRLHGQAATVSSCTTPKARTLAKAGPNSDGSIAISDVALDIGGRSIPCVLLTETLVGEVSGQTMTSVTKHWWSREVPFGCVRVELSPGKAIFEVLAWGHGGVRPGQAKTPRECVEGYQGRSMSGDFEGMHAFMVEPFRTAGLRVASASMAVAAAQEGLRKALESTFGAGAGSFVRVDAQRPAPTMEIKSVREEGARATVALRSSVDGRALDVTMQLEKSGEHWFAHPPQRTGGTPPTPPAAGQIDAMVAARSQAATELDALAAEVEAGNLATVEAAQATYRQILSKGAQAARPSPTTTEQEGGRRRR